VGGIGTFEPGSLGRSSTMTRSLKNLFHRKLRNLKAIEWMNAPLRFLRYHRVPVP
jgi:hypothetical protein